jgi:hypothetical protein
MMPSPKNCRKWMVKTEPFQNSYEIADSNTSALRTGADDITNLNGH